jgi:flagella basal body P-ring formation protein FlgA
MVTTMWRALWMSAVVGIGVGAGAPAGARDARDPGAEDEAALMETVGRALTAAATVPGARVEVESVERPRAACAVGVPARVEVSNPVEGSARAAIKLVAASRRAGAPPCEAWSWVRFRLLARVPVATRTIRAGDALADATRLEEREIKPGHVPAGAAVVGGTATADRALVAGQVVEADALRAAGPRAGEPVKVVLIAGTMAIEQMGRAVSCARNHNCAVLASGKHVDGTFVDGRLLVEMP